MLPPHDRPLAIPGLTSYRYQGCYGWVMIGAKTRGDALREAARSIDGVPAQGRLQVWDIQRGRYVAA